MAKGLGRGFESLIPTELIDEEFDITAAEDKKDSKLTELKLTDIVRDVMSDSSNRRVTIVTTAEEAKKKNAKK